MTATNLANQRQSKAGLFAILEKKIGMLVQQTVTDHSEKTSPNVGTKFEVVHRVEASSQGGTSDLSFPSGTIKQTASLTAMHDVPRQKHKQSN